MRAGGWLLLAATVGMAGPLGIGCGHGTMSQRASEAGTAVSATLDEAYDSVRSGAQTTARYGGYVLDRAENGAVRVYRGAAGAVRGAGQDVSDASITTMVKTNLARDPELASRDIHVETDAGVVKLSGDVRDRREAARAIEDAMGTSGVYAVDSQLRWPSSQAGAQPSGAPM